MSTTFARLCAILVKKHKLPAHALTPDTPLHSLGLDSVGTVELLWNVEDAFKIELPSEPLDMPTLGDVVRCVDELVAGQGNRPPQEIPVAPSRRAP